MRKTLYHVVSYAVITRVHPFLSYVFMWIGILSDGLKQMSRIIAGD
jgi:hypothetical protein